MQTTPTIERQDEPRYMRQAPAIAACDNTTAVA